LRRRGAAEDSLFARPDRPSGFPEFFQLLNAIMGPGQNRHFTLSSHRGGQFLEPRGDAKLQKTAPSDLLARRAQKARPNFYTGYLG